MTEQPDWKGIRVGPGQAFAINGFFLGIVVALGWILVVKDRSLWRIILWIGSAYLLTKLGTIIWRNRTGQPADRGGEGS